MFFIEYKRLQRRERAYFIRKNVFLKSLYRVQMLKTLAAAGISLPFL